MDLLMFLFCGCVLGCHTEISALSFKSLRSLLLLPVQKQIFPFSFFWPPKLITSLTPRLDGRLGRAFRQEAERHNRLEEERRRQQADAILASCSPSLRSSQAHRLWKASVPSREWLWPHRIQCACDSYLRADSQLTLPFLGPMAQSIPGALCARMSLPSWRRFSVIVRRTQKQVWNFQPINLWWF